MAATKKQIDDIKQIDDMRTYLLSTRDFWGRYRDLKENYFWIATTVYAGALVALVRFRLQPNYIISLGLRNVMFLVTVALFFLVFLFMLKLHQDRIYASDVISSCDVLLARLLDPAFKTKQKLTNTYQEAKNLREYLSNLVTELGVPQWTFKKDRNKWNYYAPLLFVILVTITCLYLILYG